MQTANRKPQTVKSAIHYLFRFSLFSIIGLSLSCSKDLSHPVDPILRTTVDKFEDFNPEYSEIRTRVESFKEQSRTLLENSFKSTEFNGEDVPIAEALWTLEAAINEYYHFPVSEFSSELLDTLHFNVMNVPNPSSSHFDSILVSGADLSSMYFSLISQIDGLLRINAELMFSDIKYVAHNTSSTQFSIVLFTGYSGTFSLTPDAVNATDNWKAGNGLGKCNGTQIGRDAADRLSQIANWNIKYGFVQNYYGTYWNNQPAYFTGVVTKWEGTDYAYTLSDKLLGRNNDVAGAIQGLCGLTKPVDFCVVHDDMDLYYSEIMTIIGQAQPTSPFLDAIYVKIIDDAYYCPLAPQPVEVSHRSLYIQYGIPVFIE